MRVHIHDLDFEVGCFLFKQSACGGPDCIPSVALDKSLLELIVGTEAESTGDRERQLYNKLKVTVILQIFGALKFR